MKADTRTLPDFPALPESSHEARSRSRGASAIAEINRLHAEAQRLAGESRQSLDGG